MVGGFKDNSFGAYNDSFFFNLIFGHVYYQGDRLFKVEKNNGGVSCRLARQVCMGRYLDDELLRWDCLCFFTLNVLKMVLLCKKSLLI